MIVITSTSQKQQFGCYTLLRAVDIHPRDTASSVLLSPVYTIQAVVKPVVKPV